MIFLGRTARLVREADGLTQKEAAERLGVSSVHLCNIENNKAAPSAELLSRYQRLWNVDLYVLAWCLFGDVSSMPQPVQDAARQLADAWRQQYEAVLTDRDLRASVKC